MDTITITVAENDPDVVVSATLNEDAVTITLNEAAVGATGTAGAAGVGVPTGGATNDILKKTSATDYATGWETPTSSATANTVVRRDALGGAEFGEIFASSFFTTASDGTIFTGGTNAHIFTSGASATIYTQGASADIYTSNSSASVKSYNFAAFDGAGASLKTSAGTAVLTWGVSGQNITVTAGTAVTFNATSYTFGTGAAVAMNTALGLTALATTTPGTGVATALAVNVGSAGAFVVNGGALGTPQSGTVTNLTGTASININGTVGATTATTGAFTTITASSTITGATHNGGTAANDDLTLQGTTNATRTSSYVIIQPNGGFVGIGQSTPALALDIVTAGSSGVFRARNTQASGYTGFELFGDAGTQLAAFGTGNSTAGFYPNQMYLGTNTAAALNLYTTSASNVRMYISAAGGVSIGNTTDAGATNLSVTGRITGTAGIVYGTFTVGTFPSTTYLEAVVTDALAPSVGATVAAGGSAKCKVMYNGSAKIVTAVL